MAFASTRGAVAASAIGLLVGLGGLSPVLAQTNSAVSATILSQAAAPLPSGSAEQRAAVVKERIAALVAAQSAGQVTANQVRAAIRALIVANPAVAGEIVATVVAVSSEGLPGVPANPALTVILADGVAMAAQELQVAAPNNPVAQAALQQVNTAFVEAGVSPGSVFGSQFAVTLNAVGGTLVPTTTATPSESSPLAVVVPGLLPKATTAEMSPT